MPSDCLPLDTALHVCSAQLASVCAMQQFVVQAETRHRPVFNSLYDALLVQVCDEGHRLKAKGGNKTIDSLLALNCPKRIVLTGTPVQNNLDEFYGGRTMRCRALAVLPPYQHDTVGDQMACRCYALAAGQTTNRCASH